MYIFATSIEIWKSRLERQVYLLINVRIQWTIFTSNMILTASRESRKCTFPGVTGVGLSRYSLIHIYSYRVNWNFVSYLELLPVVSCLHRFKHQLIWSFYFQESSLTYITITVETNECSDLFLLSTSKSSTYKVYIMTWWNTDYEQMLLTAVILW